MNGCNYQKLASQAMVCPMQFYPNTKGALQAFYLWVL